MTGHDTAAGTPITPQEGNDPPVATPILRSQRSSKIRVRHLDRLAIVSVRQSSPQQVLDHKESRERQYELVNHALALGWPKSRTLVIDDDQGRTAKTPDSRHGFQRLLTEVSLDHPSADRTGGRPCL